MSEYESIKVNLYLFGIIGLFILLTFIAYLLTDGRSVILLPIARRCCPRANWIREEQSKVNKKIEMVDMSHHYVGLKRSSNAFATRNGKHDAILVA